MCVMGVVAGQDALVDTLSPNIDGGGHLGNGTGLFSGPRKFMFVLTHPRSSQPLRSSARR